MTIDQSYHLWKVAYKFALHINCSAKKWVNKQKLSTMSNGDCKLFLWLCFKIEGHYENTS